MTMLRMFVVLALAAVATSVPAGDGKKDEDQFQGTWTVVRFERDGKAQVGPKSVKIKGDELTIVGDDKSEFVKFKLDASKSPKQIDLIVKGVTVPGIYQLDKGKLTLCWSGGGEPRPTKFASNDADTYRLMVLERKKE